MFEKKHIFCWAVSDLPFKTHRLFLRSMELMGTSQGTKLTRSLSGPDPPVVA